MTSEIRVNKLQNRVGLGTVTYADTGIIVSGIVTCTELSGLTALNIAGVGTASTLDINGDIDVDGHTNLDNVSIAGVTTASTINSTFINSTGNIEIDVDSGEFRCGAGGDFKISHSGSENILRSDFPTVFRNAANNETLAKFTPNGAVELYYNNIKMLETNIPSGHNGEVILGQKVHVKHTASGNGQIFPASGNLYLNAKNAETSIMLAADAGVHLFYNNAQKFVTTNTGAVVTGILTATSFSGDGSALTGLSGVSVANQSDNRLITSTGTTDALNGESTLTYDGNTLQNLQSGAAANLTLKTTSNSFNSLILDSNRAADTQFGIIDGRWNGNVVNRIQFVTGSDGTNKDDGYMAFHTRTSGASLAERLRIQSNGQVCIGSAFVGGGGHLTIRGGGVNTYATQDYQYVGTPSNNTTTLAQIRFTANTTGASVIKGAEIRAVSDAAWSATGDAPTRLEFHTAPDSSASVQERLRIDSNGNVGINETSPQQQLHVHDDSNYNGILVNGNSAPRIAFARSTTTTGEWSVGIDGTNGGQFVINNSNDNSNRKLILSSSGVSVAGTLTTGGACTINGFLEASGGAATGHGAKLGNLSVGYDNLYNTIQALSNSTNLHLQYNVNGDIQCNEGGGDMVTADIRPRTNNAFNLGTNSYRWANIHTNDLNLSNEGNVNEVDGTWGQYTIQEGKNDLFLINRRSGKRYKFLLQEVD